jgi:hypothetical protein
MEGVDSIARRYSVLPSQVLRFRDPMKGASIDLWAHNWGVQREQQELASKRDRRRG